MKAVFKLTIICMFLTTAFTIKKTYPTRSSYPVTFFIEDASPLPTVNLKGKEQFDRFELYMPSTNNYKLNPVYLTTYFYEGKNMITAYELSMTDIKDFLIALSRQWSLHSKGPYVIFKPKGEDHGSLGINQLFKYLDQEVAMVAALKIILNCETFTRERYQVAPIIWKEYADINVDREAIREGLDDNCAEAGSVARRMIGEVTELLIELNRDVYDRDDVSVAQTRMEYLVDDIRRQIKKENGERFGLVFLE
jgi:hypothetical protein